MCRLKIIDKYPQEVYPIDAGRIPLGGILMEYSFRQMERMIDIMEVSVKNNEQLDCVYASGKHKERDKEELKSLMNRLKRIEGQVRGVEGMLESGAYCTDILVQVSAITSALNSFNKVLLANHVKTCVAEDIRQGKDEVIDELLETLQKLMK